MLYFFCKKHLKRRTFIRVNKKIKWTLAIISLSAFVSIPTSLSLISCSNDKSSNSNSNSNDNDSLIDISSINNQLQQKVNEKLLLAQNLTNENDIDVWKNELIIDLNSILLNLGINVEQINVNLENGENGKQLISSIVIQFNKNIVNGDINGNNFEHIYNTYLLGIGINENHNFINLELPKIALWYLKIDNNQIKLL